jgi:two-component system chemotaxis sensor kinase CheA
MIIDDEELRAVFKAASEEHLQNLDDGLLHLETHPDDLTVLEALMREAHSLKGDANMLGVKDIGTLAHQLEHVLTQLKGQENRSGGASAKTLYESLAQAIATIRKLVHQAVTGEPAGVNTFHVLAKLMGAEQQKQDSAEVASPQAPPEKQEEAESLIPNPQFPIPNSQSPIPNPQSPIPNSQSSYRIETIRVGTRNLDTLMTPGGRVDGD